MEFFYSFLFFFFLMIRRPPRSTLFPYTRSSDLMPVSFAASRAFWPFLPIARESWLSGTMTSADGDRKSTRLNSSHGYISYAVFCLKKKKQRLHRHMQY